MSWLSDKVNPTSPALMGPDAQPRLLVLVKIVVAAAVLGAIYWFLCFRFANALETWQIVLVCLAIPLYCFLCYHFRPDPDAYDDHSVLRPHRVDRQDIQSLLVATWPGRFVAQTILDFLTLIRHARDRSSP